MSDTIQFVTPDTAKLLGEAGFPIGAVPDPTQGQALWWLYNKQRIAVKPYTCPYEKAMAVKVDDYVRYWFRKKVFGKDTTREKAIEEGIREACIHMIEENSNKGCIGWLAKLWLEYAYLFASMVALGLCYCVTGGDWKKTITIIIMLTYLSVMNIRFDKKGGKR